MAFGAQDNNFEFGAQSIKRIAVKILVGNVE